jgi:hypothetical protein
MGWLDDLKKGFQDGRDSQTEIEIRKTKRIYLEREREKEREFAQIAEMEKLKQMSDAELFNAYNSVFTSNEKREHIEDILKSRGYRKNNKGFFDKS